MNPFRPVLLPCLLCTCALLGAARSAGGAPVGDLQIRIWTPTAGNLPAAADGRRLNFDFETGDLTDWTVDGEAFKGQPIRGDTVTARGRGHASGHQGEFWIGGYEKLLDKPKGTLSSVPFKVTHPWATFMVAGGTTQATRVELVTADNKAFFTAVGTEVETLSPVLVDLSKLQGQEIRIRIVDEHTGHWGHVNFDNFRFHNEKPAMPARAAAPAAKGPAAKAPAGPADQFKFAGLSAEEAAKAMTLPPGFKAQVFTAEPDLINPIAFTIDTRGRLWVVQSLTYPRRAPEGEGKDTILIFEDTDGDGKADKRTVFMEKLNLVSGIEVGFGGVWVGAAPYLMFIPMKDEGGVTKPAGEPKILLDGWGHQDTHETLNSFIWGPDGWLYGCHGVFTNSFVGKPGTPKESRVHINAGIWRYHPTKHVFERYAEGTSNPWGIDYDERGNFFIEACVIPHLWHIIQNARYQRQAGQHDNPYTFDDIKQIGDHVHYQGATPHSGNGRSDSAGGGHAHSGLMVYLGDNWPDEYRGKIFMNNIHGARINMDIPEAKGSGFVGRHGKDFLLTNDRASQIIAMKYGPDGSVYFADWYDLNQCHNNNPGAHDRTTGRIYKVSFGDVKPVKVDLEKLSDVELVKLQTHKNDWFARMSRLVLQERADAQRQTAGRPIDPPAVDALMKLCVANSPGREHLRAMWALHAMERIDREQLSAFAQHLDDDVVGWMVQLIMQTTHGEPLFGDERFWLVVQQRGAKSPVIRRYLASAAFKMPQDLRRKIANYLLFFGDDATDHNLPLLTWYVLESISSDPFGMSHAAANARLPNIMAYTARRLSADATPANLEILVERFARTAKPADAEQQATIRREGLRGMVMGLKGRRGIQAPPHWDALVAAAANDPVAAGYARELSVVFGSKAAMADVRKTLLDAKAAAADRQAALDTLLAAKDPTLAASLLQLLDDAALRGPAVRGLAQYDDAGIPAAVLGKYATFAAAEKKDAIATLAARPAWAKALLAAVGQAVPKGDLPVDILRQLRSLGDADVSSAVEKIFGKVNDTEKDKLAKISKWKRELTAAASDPAPSLHQGRLLFNKTCAQCHTLFGEGGKVGPDITGSERANLDYLLLHVVDPNAVIPADYQAWTLKTTDDRVIVGLLKRNDPQGVALQTPTELITVNRADIAKLTPSPLSMMPEGLLDALKFEELRALTAYLASPVQVAALADADSAKTLFNGKDLTGWDAIEEGIFSVENGEIVGRTKTGLKKNQFLTSRLAVRDFRLVVKMKLSPDKENSGIQFRSVRIPNSHEMRGCQADAGAGWWGKLYEESGRGLLFPKKGEAFDATPFLKKDDWNTYEVVAVGGKVLTAINGNPCTSIDDDKIAREGIFGLQVHSGGPLEVRWKDFELELDPKAELKTVKK